VSDDKPLDGEIMPPESERPRIAFKYPRKPMLLPNEETYRKIYALAQLQCTQKEAAGALGCSYSLLEKFIQDNPEAKTAWWEGRQTGKVSLRRMLWKMASEGDSKVAMFLAKDDRWLKMEKRTEINDNRTIVFTDEQNRERILELVRLAQEGKK
jgi:hypothetical protein